MSVYAVTSPAAIRRESNLEVVWALSAAPMLLLLTFPYLALAAAAVLLVNLPAYTPRLARRMLGIVMLTAMAMMLSLRSYGGASDDITNYYMVYDGLRTGDYRWFLAFAGGVEIALPALLFALGKLLPALSVNGLMLCLAWTAAVLFLCWVESAFYTDESAQQPMLLGVALLMLNLFYSTQLVRQFIASVCLLYAFSASGLSKRLIFVLLAASFHLIAIPFAAIYFIGKRGFIGVASIIALAILLRIGFSRILTAIDVLPPLLVERLVYYVDNTAEYTSADLGSLRLLGQLCVVSSVAFIWARFSVGKTKPWHIVAWATAFVHVALLPIPLASLRTTLIVHSIAAGVIAYHMVSPRSPRLLSIVFNALLLYKLSVYLTMEDAPALTSTLSVFGQMFI